ncbi:MAG TPA: FHA domain-containing protein [Polyangia bacterium]|nr:FHA domain-containing protein [Polyangia bacterium]
MPVRFRILPAPRAPGAGADAGAAAGPLVERVVDIEVDGPGAPAAIRIGRSPDVELPLPFAALSAVHARLERAGDGWIVEDARSTNGTWVDGARLGADERRPLAPGAVLALGNVRLRFDGEARATREASGPGVEGTATIARRLVDDLFAASPAQAPAVRVVRGAPARRLALTTTGRAYVAGRGEACALALVVEEVSREHASFTRTDAGVVVRDLGSKNGVVCAGARVVGSRTLADGDVVEIGPVAVAIDDPVGRYLRELAAAPPVAAPVVVGEPLSPAASEPVAAPSEGVASPRRSSRLALVVGAFVLLLLGAVVAFLVASSR